MLRRVLVLLLLVNSLPLAAADPPLEIERMTWPEIRQALQSGRHTALLFNGGTEQRGPHAATGAHTLIARATGLAIARQLGTALLAPVPPFSPNQADPALPGTLGLTPALYSALNEQLATQLIRNGFRTIILLGDHGGGQRELAALAAKLNALHSPRGIRVLYCGDVYTKANAAFNSWLQANNYPLPPNPANQHASLPDTSLLLYLDPNHEFTRPALLPSAVSQPGRSSPNGIRGDARRASPELGKRFFDLRVSLAVQQIQSLLALPPTKPRPLP